MTYKIASVVLLLTLCSCKKDTNIIDEIKNSIHESPSAVQKLDFNKTEFKDRAEELMYIREYLKQELPLKFLREQPKKMRDAQYYYISIGKDYTLHETAVKLVDTTKAVQTVLVTVMQKQLTLNETKKMLKDTDFRNQQYVTKPDLDTKIGDGVISKTKSANGEQELTKIYPNVKNNFTKYHSEHYLSNDKRIKLIFKIEHISLTEMEVTDATDFSTEDEFEYGSVNGTLIISGTNYSVKGEYVGEGNFEGVAYNASGGVYSTVSWRYMYDNGISIRVETEDSSKDYDLAFIAKSTTVKKY